MLELFKNEVFEIYVVFLRSKERNSKKTSMEYDRRIREFFDYQFSKPIEELTVKDLKKIKAVNVESYVSSLLSRGNSNSTVTTKLRSVKSFFNELNRNGINVNADVFSVKLKKSKKHHDALYNMAEVQKLYDFAKTRPSFPNEQYLYLKTLFVTANRMKATLNLKWSDVKRKYDYVTGVPVWIVTVIDKGKSEIEKPISDEFYNELLSLKVGDSDDEKVFKNITEDIIRTTLEVFSRSLEGRNITIHSIKASALTIAYKMCKDINKVKQLGSHSSITTTEIYVKEEESYTEQLSYILGKEINFEKIRELSHEELLEIVMNNEEIKYAIGLKMN